MSAPYEVTLIESVRCEDTLTLRFERPEGYEFVPGQYFMLGISTADGDLAKPFSHASAPCADYLEMTTRVSSSVFKQALAAAQPGRMRAQLRGPAGRFGLREDAVGGPVFLAGGVGITPVMSILRDADHRGEHLGASLIYGSVDDACIAYQDEIDRLDRRLVRTSYVIERPSEEWRGLGGFITVDTVKVCVAQPADHCYYVTGPPAMVEAMSAVLDTLGIAEENRRVERFGR